MSSSSQSSGDTAIYNNGTLPKSKLERLFKPDLVKITDKSLMLAKMKNSAGKQGRVYAYKVQKLKNYGRKSNSPRNTKPRSAKDPEDMYDEDVSTQGNDDEDLTPRNKDELLTKQKSYGNTTPNDVGFDFEGNDDFLCIWNELDTISVDSKLSSNLSLSEYLYFENQTTVEVAFNWKKEEDAYQDSELIRFGNKTFRSQHTSTHDLFKVRKLSVFAITILQKCHELEQMQFNASQDIIRWVPPQPRLPPIPETSSEDTKTSQDYSDEKSSICKDEGKAQPDCSPIRNTHSNSLLYFILTIIGLLVIIFGGSYIRHQSRNPEPPKPLWQQYLSGFVNFIYFYK